MLGWSGVSIFAHPESTERRGLPTPDERKIRRPPTFLPLAWCGMMANSRLARHRSAETPGILGAGLDGSPMNASGDFGNEDFTLTPCPAPGAWNARHPPTPPLRRWLMSEAR